MRPRLVTPPFVRMPPLPPAVGKEDEPSIGGTLVKWTVGLTVVAACAGALVAMRYGKGPGLLTFLWISPIPPPPGAPW